MKNNIKRPYPILYCDWTNKVFSVCFKELFGVAVSLELECFSQRIELAEKSKETGEETRKPDLWEVPEGIGVVYFGEQETEGSLHLQLPESSWNKMSLFSQVISGRTQGNWCHTKQSLDLTLGRISSWRWWSSIGMSCPEECWSPRPSSFYEMCGHGTKGHVCWDAIGQVDCWFWRSLPA